MENQHRKITGYRELTQAEIDLMNEIKQKGEEFRALCEKVRAHVTGQHELLAQAQETVGVDSGPETLRLLQADPYTWLSGAQYGMQTALMALTRAVAQPTSF